MTMVAVALPAIAESFSITLGHVGWVVIINSLIISALMLPMGRAADTFGRLRMHLWGIVLFAAGALSIALAPTFALLLTGRALMAVGSAMGQSVGTAMIVAVFPPEERGKAIGSQTTAVAIGAASGPILGGVILDVLSWQALFALLLVPVLVAFVVGVVVLDESMVSPAGDVVAAPYDWPGAVISALAITSLVMVINNPLRLTITSPWLLGLIGLGIALSVAFVLHERRFAHPMLRLEFFSDRLFALLSITRILGFMGTTTNFFLTPVYLISVRGVSSLTAGSVMFANSLCLAVSAQIVGRLSDRYGNTPFIISGFALTAATGIGVSLVTSASPLWLVAILVALLGIAMGMWNVPNNATLIGRVSSRHHGVVGALTNLLRNLGNVTGQAVSVSLVAGVMAMRGFDVPLGEVSSVVGATEAFEAGWRAAYLLVAALAVVAMGLSWLAQRSERSAT